MLPILKIRALVFWFLVLLAGFGPGWLCAQDDPNETPLGDVARNFRKKSPPSQNVIDDENLPLVMQKAESRHPFGSALKFMMTGEGNRFEVAVPDATCSLSFSPNTKALLSKQYAQMELPPGEISKLEGPATVEGDALIVPVHNRTDWHVSEVAVALTIIKKSDLARHFAEDAEVRPEKSQDVTVIYRMRAAAPPSETTVFSTRLVSDVASDEEWHWAIVQAKGYPPQNYSGNSPQPVTTTAAPALVPSALSQANPAQAAEPSPSSATPGSPASAGAPAPQQ